MDMGRVIERGGCWRKKEAKLISTTMGNQQIMTKSKKSKSSNKGILFKYKELKTKTINQER